MNPLIPAIVEPGDTIGIAAPAGPFDRKLFHRGVAMLCAMGYRLVIPDQIYDNNGYLAGPDRSRAETLNGLFADPDIKGIVCARGGYGAMRVLPYLDFDLIRNHPKAVVGFSDVTALHAALYARSGLISCHGPSVTTLADADDATVQSLAAVLSRSRPKEMLPAAGGRTLLSGVAAGPLIGGNLAVLNHMVGTAFIPDLGGCLLLLEDLNEAPYRVDRMLTQMRLAGLLGNVAGVVVGQFENCGDMEEIDGIVTEAFSDPGIPILAGFEIGHGKTNLSVPLGMDAVLDADRQVLTFEF
jgi:muramoyltetrapeptide carboxypeptidase